MSERTDARTVHGAVSGTVPDPSGMLITPEELAALLATDTANITEAAPSSPAAPRTRVLDVRWTLAEPNGHSAYLGGHVPGAVYVDLESELSDHGPAERGRHPLPCAAALTESARRWGLGEGDTVVAYDGSGNLAAARLWWLLRDAGFERVRLLDGALPAWITAGLPLETGDVTPAPGTVTLTPGHSPALDLEAVAGFAREHVLLDARAAERYAGTEEPIDPRAGHIPLARSLPTAGNLDASGRFLPVAALREGFAAIGAVPGTEVAVYCGSGITASHELFALALAGIDGALFPGSWSQWSQDPELPVATGHTP